MFQNAWAKDCLINRIIIKVGRLDLLKLALGWSLEVRVETETDSVMGRVQNVLTDITSTKPSWWPLRKASGGMHCNAEDQASDELIKPTPHLVPATPVPGGGITRSGV